ncbi:sensitivity to high expression protein she9 [Coemansia guatemalensis]|uniref:Sensitive to high expression protein 9, mitochondrial n=1 Tax=Coemansia guatemalensis TaxID=2761395 RepID=A0A9W8HTP2_9FUNG|nr:sensitivity to high expression protein she9 [Coemansia guatemalensis]
MWRTRAVAGCLKSQRLQQCGRIVAVRRLSTLPSDRDTEPGSRHSPDAASGDSREASESALKKILDSARTGAASGSARTSSTQGNDTHATNKTSSSRSSTPQLPSNITARERALVPLNVIYLPPPEWHQPLKPRTRQTQQQFAGHDATKEDSARTSNIRSGKLRADTGGAYDPAELKGDATVGVGTESKGSSIIARLSRIFAPKPAAQSASDTRSKERNTDVSSESLPKASESADHKSKADLSHITAEKWQGGAAYRLLGAWRRMMDTVKTLPKDDDWVTWAGKTLNVVTGYDRVAQLKLKVETSGDQFHSARQELDKIKLQHAQTIKDRISSQREINSLLQRKHLWNEDDVARFTDLYRDEHQAESTEHKTAAELRNAESLVDKRYNELVSSIRERYHEEQVWSDKIRRASTYGTWAVLFMNIIALFMAQAIFEPRKRRKIVAGVDEKLALAMEEQQSKAAATSQALENRLAEQQKIAVQMAEHMHNMSVAISAISAKQEASSFITRTNTPSQHPSSAIDQSLFDGGAGYSDAELDMYYAQANKEHVEPKPLIPGSMIWRAVRNGREEQTTLEQQNADVHQKSRTQTYSRAEAGQLALETAAVASILVGAVTYWLAA